MTNNASAKTEVFAILSINKIFFIGLVFIAHSFAFRLLVDKFVRGAIMRAEQGGFVNL
jgi:hypothetical protein